MMLCEMIFLYLHTVLTDHSPHLTLRICEQVTDNGQGRWWLNQYCVELCR